MDDEVAALVFGFCYGKTVVEAMNNLDIVIEEWIETAREIGRAIPSPTYYEDVEFVQASEDEP